MGCQLGSSHLESSGLHPVWVFFTFLWDGLFRLLLEAVTAHDVSKRSLWLQALFIYKAADPPSPRDGVPTAGDVPDIGFPLVELMADPGELENDGVLAVDVVGSHPKVDFQRGSRVMLLGG